MAYHASYGVPVTALWFFFACGHRQRAGMAPDAVCRAALSHQAISVSDGEQRRGFTLLSDIIDAHEVQGVQAGDVRDTRADISRAGRGPGFLPRVPFEEGLAAQIDWMHGEAVVAGTGQ
jgi:nucleoside-diphosphate-sugar epimerase